jgi:acylphosphatase
MKPEIRVRVLYNGRVQGVGFRFSFVDAAISCGVTGFVRNLSDGRVEAVCEGDNASIEELLGRINNTMSRYISNSEISREDPTGKFEDFNIRY